MLKMSKMFVPPKYRAVERRFGTMLCRSLAFCGYWSQSRNFVVSEAENMSEVDTAKISGKHRAASWACTPRCFNAALIRCSGTSIVTSDLASLFVVTGTQYHEH